MCFVNVNALQVLQEAFVMEEKPQFWKVTFLGFEKLLNRCYNMAELYAQNVHEENLKEGFL
jgi:hypothetical protein